MRRSSMAGLGALLAWASLGLAVALPAPLGAAERPRGPIHLLVLGEVPADIVEEVAASASKYYGLTVKRLEPRPLPKAAYYPPRKRYRAEKLLEHLTRLLPAGGGKIIGLTSVDISTTKGRIYDWGIFGLGDMPGPACVVSTFRLKRKAKDRAHLLFRVRDVALHELGHTFGLDHCPTPGCIMNDARGKISTVDHSSGELCADCKRALGMK